MSNSAARRLPGIRFNEALRALDEALPRMDVAAFVRLRSPETLNAAKWRTPLIPEVPAFFSNLTM